MSASYPTAIACAADVLLAAAIEQLDEKLTTSAASFDALAREMLQRVGQQLCERLAAKLADAAVLEAKQAGFVVQRGRDITFTTLYGPVTVASPAMRHRDGRYNRPVNNLFSLDGRGRTLTLQRAMTDFGIDDSFQRAVDKLKEHYGLDMKRDSVLRVVEHNGEAAIDYIKTRLFDAEALMVSAPTTAVVEEMVVSLDGSTARTGTLVPVEGSTARTPRRHLPVKRRLTLWRDVRVGLVRPLQETEKSYIASLSSLDDSALMLRALALSRGATEGSTFIKLLDGGPGLREAVDRAMKGPTILDRPHFHHQLYETAEMMGISAEVRTGTVLRWSRMAASGQLPALLSYLRRWRPPDWTLQEEEALQQPRDTVKLPHAGLDRVRQLIAHLTRFSDAVHYDAFKDKGYPVGSGEVESAHRMLPQPRLKKPGTWWLPQNIDGILALRVIRQNGWWDDFWSHMRSSDRAVA